MLTDINIAFACFGLVATGQRPYSQHIFWESARNSNIISEVGLLRIQHCVFFFLCSQQRDAKRGSKEDKKPSRSVDCIVARQ